MIADHRLGERCDVAQAHVQALPRNGMDDMGGIADQRQALGDEAPRHPEAERIGERDWADRAYSEALRRRKLIPQSIEGGFLIERLINVPFIGTAARASARGRELPRQYLWVQRTREISGVCTEGEAGSSAAWEKYFRESGDLEHARHEAAYRDALSRAPINLDAASTESDIALYLTFAAFVVLCCVVGRTLLVRGIRHLRASGSRLGARTAAAVLGTSLVVGLTGILVFGLGPYPDWTMVQGLSSAGLLFGASSVLWNRGIRKAIVSLVASLSLAERFAIAVAILVFAAAAGRFAGTIERCTGLSQIPIGVMDGVGNPQFADTLESSKGHVGDSPKMRYCLAVASHMAGDLKRARELYSSLPDDPRARENLAALGKGAILPVHPLRDAEIADAFIAGTWNRAIRRLFFWRPIQPSIHFDSIEWIDISVFFTIQWTMVGAVTLLVLTLAIKRSGTTAPLSLGALASSFAVPFLLSFALPPMLFLVRRLPSPVIGPYTSTWYHNFHQANPYPNPATVKTEAADLAYNYWTDFWAMPHAKFFWAAVAVSLVLGLFLAVVSWKQSLLCSRGPP